jgi:ABC-type bacteriocin/lantibiotic exporter with double-glycine peptidase domain
MRKNSVFIKRLYFLSAVLFNGLFAIIVVQYAEMVRLFFDNAQLGISGGYLRNFVLLMFFILCQTVFHYIASMCTNRLYLINKKTLQKNFFDSVMQKDIQHIREHSTGKLQNIIMNDIDSIAKLLSFTYIKAIHIIIKTLLFVGYLFSIDVLLGFISLLISPILLVFGISFSKVIRQSSTEYSIKKADLNAKYNEFFQYNLFFKLFNSKDYLDTQVDKEIQNYNKVAKRAYMISTLFDELSSAVGQIANIVVLAIGAYMISQKTLTTGGLVAFMHIQNQVVWPLVTLNSLFGVYQSSKGKQDVIDQILNLPAQKHSIELLHDFDALLAVKNVSVSLKDRKVLKEINFSIFENELVLIMGENGVGKSTLLNTLFGLYSPDEGEVKYNSLIGTDINNQAFEYCVQQTTVIEGTLRENICLDNTINDQTLLEMCEKFNFLDDFPDGLDSHIQFNGGSISGGQSRKISLIRSLISTKPILILDEPFAALDTLSVQILVEIIEELKKSKTIIVISHSNELFDIVDKILYVNSDGIISSTFDDLRLNNQEFNKLISA